MAMLTNAAAYRDLVVIAGDFHSETRVKGHIAAARLGIARAGVRIGPVGLCTRCTTVGILPAFHASQPFRRRAPLAGSPSL